MHKRGLTTLLTLAGFILMTGTGIVLFFTPQGRIAYWTDWTFLALTKEDWGNIHIISSFLWVAAGAFHLWFNWKVLVAYLSKRVKELVVAIAVTVLVTVFSIWPVPPFSSFLDLGAYLSDSWIAGPEYEPPIGHAEQLSFKTFTKKMNIDEEAAIQALDAKGIKIDDSGRSMQSLAEENNTSPMDIYMIIRPLEKKPEQPAGEKYTPEMVEEQFTGTGLGQKTLPKLAGELGKDLDEVKGVLKTKGIEIPDDEKLKDAADRFQISPIDIIKAILIEDYTIKLE